MYYIRYFSTLWGLAVGANKRVAQILNYHI